MFQVYTILSKPVLQRSRAFQRSFVGLEHVAKRGLSTAAEKSPSSFWDDEGISSLDRSKHAISDAEQRLKYFQQKYPIKQNKGKKEYGEEKLHPLPSTVHSSRHFPGPLCPADKVEASTSLFLAREYGSLYQPPASFAGDEDAHIFQLRENVEYLMRGHAACIPDSYLQRQAILLADPDRKQRFLNNNKIRVSWENPNFSVLKESTSQNQNNPNLRAAQSHLHSMTQILERLEEEARLFWVKKHGSKLMVSDSNNNPDKENDQDEKEVPESEITKLDEKAMFKTHGPPPGPTTAMYDLLLDANAACMKLIDPKIHGYEFVFKTLEQGKALQERALWRYRLDGGPANTSPLTLPTPMTFNAVLACVSNIPYKHGDNEMVRDEAIDLAFGVYTDMNDFHRDDQAIARNAATYVYMLRCVHKFIPDSRSKGNIAYGIFCHASQEDRVVNQQVWDVITKEYPNDCGGPDFQSFQNAHSMWTRVQQLPMFWRQHNTKRRYAIWDDGSY